MRIPSSITPMKRRVRRKRRGAPAAAALTLVAASFDPVEETVLLTFDRAIDVSGWVGSALTVNDPVSTVNLLGGTWIVEMMSAASVRVTLDTLGDASGSVVLLVVDAGNGVVAAGDGAAWAGTGGVALPFG
ncbi:MAG TPA: hypothetical protein VLI90_03100 [Tepidisphaeraceae bacterium]|nr:hypothetical protein [Tepidisphaeraceae bacterium]